MTFRAPRVLYVPASITLLSAMCVHPPTWMVRHTASPLPVRQVKPVAKQGPEKRPVPRIIAVNARIAKRVNALRPTVKERLERVVQRLPERITLLVTSATRTRAEQAALRPTFGVKARPGHSTHEDGRAIDVNVLVDGERISPRLNQKFIGAAMASEGFKYLGRRDPVHYSLPKDEVDLTLTSGPALHVVTMSELREIEAHNEWVDELERLLETSPTAAADLPLTRSFKQVGSEGLGAGS